MEVHGNDDYGPIEALAHFFENVGVLSTLRILNFQWVNLTLGSAVFRYRNMWHLVVRDVRTIPQNHEAYRNWEDLARVILKRRRQFLEATFPEFPSGDPPEGWVVPEVAPAGAAEAAPAAPSP